MKLLTSFYKANVSTPVIKVSQEMTTLSNKRILSRKEAPDCNMNVSQPCLLVSVQALSSLCPLLRPLSVFLFTPPLQLQGHVLCSSVCVLNSKSDTFTNILKVAMSPVPSSNYSLFSWFNLRFV